MLDKYFFLDIVVQDKFFCDSSPYIICFFCHNGSIFCKLCYWIDFLEINGSLVSYNFINMNFSVGSNPPPLSVQSELMMSMLSTTVTMAVKLMTVVSFSISKQYPHFTIITCQICSSQWYVVTEKTMTKKIAIIMTMTMTSCILREGPHVIVIFAKYANKQNQSHVLYQKSCCKMFPLK